MNREMLCERVAIVSRLTGEFTLRSGVIASEYFDKYRFESDPMLLAAIADHLVGLVPTGTEYLAGLELGGIPIATALSLRTGIPVVFVRKQAKDYGTKRLAEGSDVEGARLCVVEDVVTSGGQVLLSCEQLRSMGAEVETAVCVIDRESGGVKALDQAGIELRSLFARSELDRVAHAV